MNLRYRMKPWNNHNHYHGEELHDDGYFGSEIVQCCDCKREGHPDYANKCEQCKSWYCPDCDEPIEVDGMMMCSGCADDYHKDHPDWETLIAEGEYLYDSMTNR